MERHSTLFKSLRHQDAVIINTSKCITNSVTCWHLVFQALSLYRLRELAQIKLYLESGKLFDAQISNRNGREIHIRGTITVETDYIQGHIRTAQHRNHIWVNDLRSFPIA